MNLEVHCLSDPDGFWENYFYLKQYFSTGSIFSAEVFVTNISHICLENIVNF